jgi:tetratricopeptide (TPR) repeat protein
MLWRYSQHLLHSYGELHLRRGDLDAAVRYADECLVSAQRSNTRKNSIKALRLRGQVATARSTFEDAERDLSDALQLALEIGNPTQLWKTWAALGEMHAAAGHDNDARSAFREALAVIDRIAGELSEDDLRRTFLDSRAVREIRDRAD